jgi:hypothetical protein
VALKPREAEIRGWVEQGRSDAWIGEKLGTSAGSLQSFRFHNSIPRRPTLGEDELACVRTWVEEGKSHAWIGERLGKTAVAVVSLCSRNGIASPYRFSPEDLQKGAQVGRPGPL